MKSGMSCFNRTVFWKNITSTVPLSVIYVIALVLLYPLGCCRSWASGSYVYADALLNSCTTIGGTFFTGIFAFAAAFFCFRYLNKTTSSYMLHSLPVSRKSLYVSNLLSGLVMGIVPFAVIYLFVLSMSVSATAGWGSFALYLLMYLFYYGLAVVSMIVTANGLAAAALYAFLNIGIVVLEALAANLITPMLFGINYEEPYTLFLSPAIWLLRDLDSGESAATTLLHTLGSYAWVMGVVGVAAMVAGYWFYCLRHAESAGEIVAHKATRPVFRYLVTATASLALGLLFCFLLTNDIDITKTPAIMLGSLLFAAFLGFFGAEMLLEKKLKVFNRRAAAGFAAFCGLLLLCIGLFWFDVFGICSKVPEAGSVEQVELQYGARTMTFNLQEEREISEIVALHESITENRAVLGSDVDQWNGTRVTLTYRLKNGGSLTRSYLIKPNASAMKQLMVLLKNRQVQLNYLTDSFKQADSFSLDYCCLAEVTEDGTKDYYWTDTVLTSAKAGKLLEALLEDTAAGRYDVIDGTSDYDSVGTLYLNNGRTLIATATITREAESTLACMEALGLNPYLE